MKKIVALMMALAMVLSCTAFADTAKTATKTTAQIYINPQLLAGAPEEAVTLVDTINSLQFTTIAGEDYTTVSYGANDTKVCEYTVASAGEGQLMFFSSLYPTTAILLDLTKIGALIETYVGPIDWEEVLLGAQSAIDEALLAVEPYLTDVMTVAEQVMNEAQVDETGTSAYMSITTAHVATLLGNWVDRLSTDYTMQTILATVYELVMQNEYDAPSFDEFLAALATEVEQLKAAEAMEIGSVGVYNSEGSMSVEIAFANVALFCVDLYSMEGMDFMDLMMVFAQDGTDDWNVTLENVYAGVGSDVVLGVSVMGTTDYTSVQSYVVAEGQTMSATIEETIENAGTDAQVTTTVASMDMSMGTENINLGGIAAETVLVEDTGMPSVDDKYVLDVLALPVDMLMNGLPAFAENIVTAMPEAVQMVIDALAQIEGLEILQTISVLPEEVTTNEEVVEVVPDKEVTGSMDEIAPAVQSAPVVTSDDEIAPMSIPQTQNAIEGGIEDM